MSKYLYFRYHPHYDNVVKFGSTTDIIKRDYQYATGEFNRGEYKKVIEIFTDLEIIKLEKLCHTYYKSYHTYIDGGREFFHDIIINDIENLLDQMNISYVVLLQSDIDNLFLQYRLSTLINSLKKTNINKYIKSFLEKNNITNNTHLTIKKYTPRDYQQDILDIDFYKNNDIGMLLWACGLGKSLMSLFITQQIKASNVLICVPTVSILNQFYNDCKNMTNNIFIVQGSKLKQTIKDFIKCKENKIMISLYHHTQLILNICNDFIFDFKIGDEAHHLVTKMKDTDTKSFDKFHQIKSKKTLFMTATRKELEQTKNIYTMSDEKIFGKVIDEKSIKWAIENNCITDYKVRCIYNNDEEIYNILDKLNIKVSDYNKEKIYELFLSAYSTLLSIEKGLISHLLLYTNSIKNASIINNMIDKLLKSNYFNIDDIYYKELSSRSETYHTIDTVIECDYCKDRFLNNKIKCNMRSHHDCDKEECIFYCLKPMNNIFHKYDDDNCEMCQFKKAQYGIISCVYLFGEGFNLPELNGVVIGENMGTEIRIVQSCLRPNRKDKKQPDKIAEIIIPYTDTNITQEHKLYQIISMMKEYDEIIEQKIKVVDIRKKESTKNKFIDRKVSLKKNKKELYKLKLKLLQLGLFGNVKSKKVLMKEYEYMKKINNTQFKTIESYNGKIKNPDDYFYGIEFNWFDFLNIDTTNWLDYDEWIKYINDNKISSVEMYYEHCENNNTLPYDASEYYGLKNLINMLYENIDEYLFT